LSTATPALSWALGGACILLGVFTVNGWLRQRDRTRAFLALSIVLLCGCGVAVAATMLTSERATWTSDLSLTLFLASGWAFFGFRAAMTRLSALLTIGVSLVVLATIVLVCIAGISVAGAQSTPQHLVVLVLALVWLGCVVEPAIRLWGLSAALPRVQRARLRSITLAYAGVIVALLLAIGAEVILGRDHPEITVVLPALAVLPFFYVGFEPPRWLLGFWRQGEEGHFREAFTELVMYSPDRQGLAERAVEWAARLVGADGAVIATDDGEVLAVHGLDRSAAWELVSDASGDAGARSVTRHPTSSRGVIRVVLEAQLSRGIMAVTSGPLTPLFGDDEALRLTQYATALAPALDRVLLVERMQRSSQLLDLAYDAVTTWNVRTQLITFWNKGAEELYGWGSDEAIGREPAELLRSELPASREVILDTLQAVGRWEGEIIQTTKAGHRINVAVRWALQKDGAGWPDAVIEIGRDITADKVAAAELRDARDVAEQASQAKSEYLSRMSHELRTPLTAILGYSDLLEMREPRDDQTEAIAAVQEAGGHLLSLVNDVLDIARIESGRETFALEPVALEATVEECVRLVAPSALSRHIKITRSLGDCAADYVLADRQRLVQALLNLLSNAVKYSGNDAHIHVEAARETETGTAGPRRTSASAGEFIRLAVRDTGPGFSDDEKARLFQPFERLGAERTTIPGTGLGLALTRKLVQGMHGTIGVDSERGEGSSFWIRLNRSPASVLKTRVRRKPPVVIPVVAGRRTVLYVEDNLATVGLMEEVFAMRPQIRLITAMQGGLTLELAREHHPDLIVLDLHLPDIQGDDVLVQLRADPRTAGIPVVMCSADATERRRKQLLAAGAYAYLTKPVKVQRFLRMLDEVLNSIPVSPA
jgi:PAS domain S-box-containing protein